MSVLGMFLLGQDYFDRQVADLSGGEKSRLILASLFLARANFLVLDEPTNHLDLESREALIEALEAYEGTILLVAHDRHLLSRVAEQCWELSAQGVEIHDDFETYDRLRKERLALASGKDDSARDTVSRDEAKRRKRAEAELRNALYKELAPKRNSYEKLEKELEQRLDRQTAVEAELADPEVYADPARSSALLDEYRACQEQSEALLAKLGRLETDIQAIETKRRELGLGE